MSVSVRVYSKNRILYVAKVRLGIHMGWKKDLYLGTFGTRQEAEAAAAAYRAKNPYRIGKKGAGGPLTESVA